jgi:hypothetical protein
VKISTSLEMIGGGSLLLIAGALIIGFGGAYGFAELTHLPLWASLLIVGLLIAFAGYVMLNRVADKTEEQVKQLPVVEAIRSPWLIAGAAVAGGFILSRLTRSEPPRTIEIVTPNGSTGLDTVHLSEVETTQHHSKPGLGHKIGEQLRTFGSLASGMALTMGMKALGIPPLDQLAKDLLGNLTGEAQDEDEPTPQERQQRKESRPGTTNGRQPQAAYNTGNSSNRNDNFYGENF